MARTTKLLCLAVCSILLGRASLSFLSSRTQQSTDLRKRRNLLVAGGASLLLGERANAWGEDEEDHPLVAFDVDVEGGDGMQTERVVLKLHPEWAPRGVRRFASMMRMGDLEGSRLHHVDKDFGVFFGLPAEPTLELDKIRNDRVRVSNKRGTVAFKAGGLLRQSHSRSQELFINTKDNSHLDKDGIAPIAEVVEGMDAIDKAYAGYGRAPDVQQIKRKGTQYLDTEFPKLGRIVSVHGDDIM
ncbi:unnamed protein product [Effrenium voratum]|nr:unnamed protein product [Effrenium voratum]|mmetsp:Transcript_91461/g.217964  ORF Transcript_91461/g.217964 Transcript_91461/m.217964 type:complete len:243 (+) Transcript_91461:61-789(+)|eukprot:CAMPEP_0181434240 /NCGR_PEP_ID=MMETSP1110-20121109/19716_1 /TAXON_ID=174948 /ORGANISM="Symbiodinium sp., Strain CCMP421" /LENGTH=242 /DNA_ID=CAMNT_0023557739 /DNA_START=61 /DNA_END=789 /DNA_ORIENTATION=+